jgi:hypothetical protein
VGAFGDRAEAIVSYLKSRAADEIASLATMVRNAAQSIDQGKQGAVTDYASGVANQIDQFANRLRHSSWRVLAADAEGLARRWPALFMASSAAMGFVLGRMLMVPAEDASGAGTWTPATGKAESTSRAQSGAIGGTLSDGGSAAGYGLPAGGERL